MRTSPAVSSPSAATRPTPTRASRPTAAAAGRPISHFDAQIAAIARSAGAAIATRNVTDYDRCGVKILNPWDV